MTALLVRDVVSRMGRLLGLWASGDSPSASQGAEALIAMNGLKRAMFGTFIGPRLSAQAMTGTTGQGENGGLYSIPANAFTFTLPTGPKSGARVGVVDANLNFGAGNCTVARNGRLLEGAASNLILNVAGTARQWWFRADTGNWVREADWVSLNDAIEFPDALIVYLPYMLAVAIGSEYGPPPSSDVIAGAVEGREAFARTYARRGRNQIDPPVGVTIQQQAQAA